MDACTAPSGLDSPGPGDLSICIQCSGFLVFDVALKLQKLEPEQEFQLALKDPAAYAELMKLRSSVREIKEGTP
jgi:hypothetical protein